MSDLGNKKIMAANTEYYMALNHKDRNDICRDLGFKYTTFCDWVNAKTYPRIDKIEKLANYFGIEKADLVEERSADKISPEILDLAKEIASLPQHKMKEALHYVKYLQTAEDNS